MSIADKLVAIAENQQKVYEAGKKAGDGGFWDGYQQKGEKVSYRYAFMYTGWNDETFKPKYDFHITDAYRMFKYTRIKDLAQDLKNCNVVLDTSNCTDFKEMFQESKVTYLPTLDMRKATNTISTFRSCLNLISIEKLIVAATTPYGSNCFTGCSNLTHVVFEGTIGKNLDIRYSTKLTHESLMSIIEALKDYSKDTSSITYKLTIGSTNIAKLTQDELDIIKAKGWDYA